MTGALRVQGDAQRELASLSEGFCPGDGTELVTHPPVSPDGRGGFGYCTACHLVWETGRSADGTTPGYGYMGAGVTEWYWVHSLAQPEPLRASRN